MNTRVGLTGHVLTTESRRKSILPSQSPAPAVLEDAAVLMEMLTNEATINDDLFTA